MPAIDFLTNAFTQYGFAALASEAADESAAESDVIEASAVLGTVAPAGVGTLTIEEPGPDATSQLGLRLELRPFNDMPLFTGQPREDETVQGFLGNCPLVAILTAMAHIHHFRSVLVAGAVVRERPMSYSTFRQRQLYEFLASPTPPDPLPRVPGIDRNFEGDHVFAVNFFEDPQQATIGKRAEIFTLAGGHTVTKIVSPVLYFDTDPPEGFFYAHSTRRNLWVNIIEKGFVFLHGVSTPAPAYQDINDGLDPNKVMSEVTGYSRMGLINNSGNPGIPELKAKQLRSWMKLHNTRPTILGSLDNPANPDLIVADHTFALVGFDASAHQVTLINAIEEDGSPDRIIILPIGLIHANFEEIVQGPFAYGSAP